MLPQAYALPAAVLLVLSGALSCFAGYRLFRLVLGLYGFILGAILGSSEMGTSNGVGMGFGALVGGLVGALALVFGYFVGVALVGGGLGAIITQIVWTQAAAAGEPPALLVIAMAIVGTLAAMLVQRYVVVVSTAFGGSWTVIVGTLAAMGNRAAERAASNGVWILYPLAPAPGERWVPVAWVVLGLIGTAVQLGLTGGKK